jgi:hypothetical protein
MTEMSSIDVWKQQPVDSKVAIPCLQMSRIFLVLKEKLEEKD